MSQTDDSCASDADPTAMSMQAAQEKTLALCEPITGTETINTADARFRISRDAIVANISVPPFRSSAMDGYAFRHTEGEQTLSVVGSSLAGHPFNGAIPAHSCVRITTGAAIPDDADTVVMQEHTSLSGDQLTINTLPTRGFNVRAVGSDHQAGQLLLPENTPLKAPELALMASHGISKLEVTRKLVVAVLSTGDELHRADTKLQAGGIYDSNRALLINMLESPAVSCIDAGICKDSVESITEALNKVAHADLVITTGGVSVGDADFVRTALEQTGNLSMWKIAMKPGRPLTFGKLNGGAIFFGLPGNPVSAAVTYLFFVKPAILKMLSTMPPLQISVKARVKSTLKKLPGRIEYQRGVLSGDSNNGYDVQTTGLQDSHVLTSLQRANCLVELPLSSTGAKAGELVTAIPFSSIEENLV